MATTHLEFYGVNSTNKKWQKQRSYGGKLVENITQAVARDLMAESMLLLEEAGFKIVLTVHDEIITEVDIDDKNRTAERFTTIMERPPKWASGLPIKVEAYEATRYRK
jgi:DNA polymerase